MILWIPDNFEGIFLGFHAQKKVIYLFIQFFQKKIILASALKSYIV